MAHIFSSANTQISQPIHKLSNPNDDKLQKIPYSQSPNFLRTSQPSHISMTNVLPNFQTEQIVRETKRHRNKCQIKEKEKHDRYYKEYDQYITPLKANLNDLDEIFIDSNDKHKQSIQQYLLSSDRTYRRKSPRKIVKNKVPRKPWDGVMAPNLTSHAWVKAIDEKNEKIDFKAVWNRHKAKKIRERVDYLWGKLRLWTKFVSFPRWWLELNYSRIREERIKIWRFLREEVPRNVFMMTNMVYKMASHSIKCLWNDPRDFSEILLTSEKMESLGIGTNTVDIMNHINTLQNLADDVHNYIISILSEFLENIHKDSFDNQI